MHRTKPTFFFSNKRLDIRKQKTKETSSVVDRCTEGSRSTKGITLFKGWKVPSQVLDIMEQVLFVQRFLATLLATFKVSLSCSIKSRVRSTLNNF